MKILKYSETEKSPMLMRQLDETNVADTVRAIISDVAKNGDEALFAYSKKFDRAELTALEVTQEEFDAALASIPAELRAAMELAAENIRVFHSAQKREGFKIEQPDGTYMGQFVTPIEKVGLYVPGGTASYPSSVFMNAIP
ncbi:MAG: histidinol dehydrogenase, partial [Oscillospiraceae bacterium]|nr:histidinol dehydrogenase [Oscillospiraceae bacterium]